MAKVMSVPPSRNGKTKCSLLFFIKKEQKARMRLVASIRDITNSQFIREAIDEHIKRYGYLIEENLEREIKRNNPKI